LQKSARANFDRNVSDSLFIFNDDSCVRKKNETTTPQHTNKTVGKGPSMRLQELYNKYKEWTWFSAFFAAVLLLYSCVQWSSYSPQKADVPIHAGSTDGVDILIPEGQSLVPIEVTNYETLDSLLGSYGVVDLFFVDPTKPETGKKIASMVKILRAPKNPSHFAVLVPARLAQHILQYQGPFTVSVQNPKFQTGTLFEKKAIRKSRIVYE
jgi:hypothetical protein